MAGSMTNYLELEVLDHVFGKGAYTAPTPYLALFTVAPSDAGGGTEVSGGSYARQAIASNMAVASSGAITNSGAISFPTATASWGTVVAFGVMDASTAGNMLWWGDLTASKAVGSGDTLSFAAGDLDFTLD
jgi:hypothetical protein